MAITWLRYPTQVHDQIRTIAVEVALPAGVVATNIQLDTARSSPNLSLLQENGAVFSEAVTGGRKFFVSRSVIDDGEVYISSGSADIVNPAAKRAVTIALRDSASTEQTTPVEVQIVPRLEEQKPIKTSVSDFTDDFPDVGVPARLRHDLWTAQAEVAGVAVAPDYAIASSILTLNNPAVAEKFTQIVSDIIEGRCHVEFRGVQESARQANAGFQFGVGFIDVSDQGIVELGTVDSGYIYVGINMIQDGGFFNNPSTTIHFRTSSGLGDAATDQVLVLPGGALTTGLHDYVIDCDGHEAKLFLDGVVIATARFQIPGPTAKRYVVQVRAQTDLAAPALANALNINRIDVRTDERLVTTGDLGSASGASDVVLTGSFGNTATLRAPTSIADNLVHELTDAAGAGMDMDHHYAITQIGGDDIQVLEAAAAPAVATVRRSPYHLFNGDMGVFSPNAEGNRLWGVKAVDNTANASVYCDSSDGGTGA